MQSERKPWLKLPKQHCGTVEPAVVTCISCKIVLSIVFMKYMTKQNSPIGLFLDHLWNQYTYVLFFRPLLLFAGENRAGKDVSTTKSA